MEIVPNKLDWNPPAIYGAGEAEIVRNTLEKVISLANSSMFDIAELLYKIKKNGFYDGYTTFRDYTKSLNFKTRRLKYLTEMAEVMDKVGIPRAKYEPIGLAKMRAITEGMDPNGTWIDPETKEEVPISSFITELVEKGKEMPIEDIQKTVKVLKGLTGDNDMAWIHLYMKVSVIESVVKPAIEKAKMLIGSVGKDEEGISKDPSDGQASEVVYASFLTTEVGNE